MVKAASFVKGSLCLLAGVIGPVRAADAAGTLPVGVTATVDKARVTVGDVLTYTVEVVCPEGTRVTADDAAKVLAPFEVRHSVQTQKSAEGRSFITLTYQLAVFEVGEKSIAGLKLQCLLPGEQSPRRFTAPPVKVTVTSVLTPNAQDIKDIREPVPVRMTGREWALMLLSLLLIAVLIATVTVLVLRRRRRQPAAHAIIVSAHERALRELEILARSDLLPRGDLRGYYTRLSDIVREYLEARFGIPAMGETTWMIRGDLEAARVPVQWRTGFGALLQAADLVKFAREDPSDQQAEDALREARQLILVSRAVSEQAAEEVEAAPAAG